MIKIKNYLVNCKYTSFYFIYQFFHKIIFSKNCRQTVLFHYICHTNTLLQTPMNNRFVFLLFSAGLTFLSTVRLVAQARMNLGEKPKIVSVSPSDRSATSTKYTEAEESQYLTLVNKGYRQLLADSLGYAEMTFREATDFLPSHPSNAELFFQMGQIAERGNNYHTASDYYRKSLRINENLAKAYERRGAVSLILKDYDTALKCYSTLLELKPSSPQAHFYKGYTYQRQGKQDNALAEYKKTLALEPQHTSANTAIAVIRASQGHHDEAIGIMDRLITHSPKSASLYEMRGTFEMECGKNQLALYDFNKAIELAPDNPTAYLNRAVIYGRSKQKSMAELDLRKAQDLGAPDSTIESARTAISKHKQKLGPDNSGKVPILP